MNNKTQTPSFTALNTTIPDTISSEGIKILTLIAEFFQHIFHYHNCRNKLLPVSTFYISGECHCHGEEECDEDSDCFEECGIDATCDNNHCHGDCVHHRK